MPRIRCCSRVRIGSPKRPRRARCAHRQGPRFPSLGAPSWDPIRGKLPTSSHSITTEIRQPLLISSKALRKMSSRACGNRFRAERRTRPHRSGCQKHAHRHDRWLSVVVTVSVAPANTSECVTARSERDRRLGLLSLVTSRPLRRASGRPQTIVTMFCSASSLAPRHPGFNRRTAATGT